MLKNIKIKIGMVVVAALAMVGCSIAGVARATVSESAMLSFSVDTPVVELDGTESGTVTVNLTAGQGENVVAVQGNFATAESDDAENYFTPSALGVGAKFTSYDGTEDIDYELSSGAFLFNSSSDAVSLETGDHVFEMTYSVAPDTPAGTYHLPINIECIQQEDFDSYEEEVVVSATVTVVRNDVPTKPAQTVKLYDADGNDITGTTINKYYGDERFKVTWALIEGDGTVSYHPNDGADDEHVARTAGDYVEIDNVGSVKICAWVSETETYAAAESCITVNVSKRPINVSSATVNNKTFDGTSDATIANVGFSDRNLNNEEYTAVANFNNANVGDGKTVRVTVTLTDLGASRYTLGTSTYDTTANIAKYQLLYEDVELPDGDDWTYVGSEIQPAVRVTASVNGGIATLVRGQDFDVTYSDNLNVGTGHVSVTGIGNYTTGDGAIIKDFTINRYSLTESDYVSGPTTMVVGTSIDPTAFVLRTREGRVLIKDTDYTVSIVGEGGHVGETANVTFDGIGNYSGGFGKQVTITDKMMPTVTFNGITGGVVSKVYGDGKFSYEATATSGGAISYSSSDPYTAAVDPATGEVTILKAGGISTGGIATVTITATSAETATYAQGTATYTLNISRKEVAVENVVVEDKIYDGTPNATVSDATLSDGSLSFGFSSGAFYAQGAYFNDVNVGNYVNGVAVHLVLDDSLWDKYAFAGDGDGRSINVTGSAKINPASVTPTIGAISAATYTGEALNPDLTVTALFGSETVTLVKDVDYTATYNNNVNVGTGSVTIAPVSGSNYTFASNTYSADFTINKAVSPNPEEMTAALTVEAGKTLADIERTWSTGFSWNDSTIVVTEGPATYGATYTHNGDGDNYSPITIDVTVYGLSGQEYEIFDGAGQEYVRDEDSEAMFKANADFALFQDGGAVYVDGVWVSPDHYRAESGSTKITFSEEYMNTLEAGTHTLAVLFGDGSMATTEFTVIIPEKDPTEEPGTIINGDTEEDAKDNVEIIVSGNTDATNATDADGTSEVAVGDYGAFTGGNGGAVVAGTVVATMVAVGLVCGTVVVVRSRRN